MSTYEGWVRHRRFGDVEHEFRYRVSMVYREVPAGEQWARIAEATGVTPDGPVFVLEAPRSLGIGFNPVRFYYAFHEERLLAVVAEVTNTPWGERRSYVLDPAGGRLDKALHVSPFMPMDQQYAWRLTEPGEQLVVHLENHAGAAKVFDATLRLHRTQRRPRPAQTLRILVSIYAQALRLKLKGAPYHPHPRTAA
jgi:DUF1365 family protein